MSSLIPIFSSIQRSKGSRAWFIRYDPLGPFRIGTTIFAYFLVAFLIPVLYVRIKGDEARCLAKYSQYWLLYTSKMPYMFKSAGRKPFPEAKNPINHIVSDLA